MQRMTHHLLLQSSTLHILKQSHCEATKDTWTAHLTWWTSLAMSRMMKAWFPLASQDHASPHPQALATMIQPMKSWGPSLKNLRVWTNRKVGDNQITRYYNSAYPSSILILYSSNLKSLTFHSETCMGLNYWENEVSDSNSSGGGIRGSCQILEHK